MGRLEFWVADSAGRLDLRASTGREDRDVRFQELNLTTAQRTEMARLLATNVLPENRDYLYHHYNDNCVTRLRDTH